MALFNSANMSLFTGTAYNVKCEHIEFALYTFVVCLGHVNNEVTRAFLVYTILQKHEESRGYSTIAEFLSKTTYECSYLYRTLNLTETGCHESRCGVAVIFRGDRHHKRISRNGIRATWDRISTCKCTKTTRITRR